MRGCSCFENTISMIVWNEGPRWVQEEEVPHGVAQGELLGIFDIVLDEFGALLSLFLGLVSLSLVAYAEAGGATVGGDGEWWSGSDGVEEALGSCNGGSTPEAGD